jgi:hypothetical protein
VALGRLPCAKLHPDAAPDSPRALLLKRHWLAARRCGHCKALKPAWEQAAAALKGIINVAAVDADQHSSLSGEYGIQGFPTIKLFYTDAKGKLKSVRGPAWPPTAPARQPAPRPAQPRAGQPSTPTAPPPPPHAGGLPVRPHRQGHHQLVHGQGALAGAQAHR